MSRRSVVLVAMLCASGMAFAQATPPAAGEHANWQAQRQQWAQKWQQERAKMEQKRMDRLAVLLDLTPAQRQQVQSIFASERSEMEQAMKQAMQARHAAHAETVTQLGQVLSPIQMKKLKLLMPHRHRFMMRGGMGMHGKMGMRGHMGMAGPMGMHGPMGMWKDHGSAPPPPPPAPNQP
jgi:hypothetical protein